MSLIKPSLGWDLAGYGDSGSGLCRADRTGETITVTVLRAPFICRPRHKIDSGISDTVQIEAEMLRRFSRVGNIYLDVPIDLQLLPSVVDHAQDERVRYYWQLVMRPIDYAFDALEPLASNLGFAVARISHILGRVAADAVELRLDGNLFETYPAAILQLICAENKWTATAYKGGKIVYLGGQWRPQAAMTKNQATQQKQAAKNSGLAVLANCLGFQADEGFEMNDDEFDAVLCALNGCVPECVVSHQSLAKMLREILAEKNAEINSIGIVEPPVGYVILSRLPKGLSVRIDGRECLTLDGLFQAIGSRDHN